jgi:hypothetical protein
MLPPVYDLGTDINMAELSEFKFAVVISNTNMHF